MKPSIIFTLLSLCLIISSVKGKPTSRNKLLYILLDAFRYDYTDDQPAENLPGFINFLQNGVRAEYVTAIYPSVSYASWTTLMTGLYAESHGIVGNYFYDAEDKTKFSLFDFEATGKKKWWKTAEPIWSTSTKAGLRTAVIFMSRCDIPFDGVVPEYCEPFIKIKGAEIFRTNAEKAMQKLQEGYDFVVLYNEYMDNMGHDAGPETEERKKGLREMDTTMVYMQNRIEEMGLTDEVNIVIVSDHGMTTVAPGDVARPELDDYLLTEAIESIADGGSFANIKVKPGKIQEVYTKLKKMPGVDVYLHDEIPDEFHYKNNKYIHDIIITPNVTTYMMKSRSKSQFPTRNDNEITLGAHGYDPKEEKMRAIFFAKGPDFKKNQTIPAIQTVDVYPLLAHLLRVNPLPNNGTMTIIQKSLMSQPVNSVTNYQSSSCEGWWFDCPSPLLRSWLEIS